MFPKSLLTTLLLALSVAATPLVQIRKSPVTLSLSKRVNSTSVQNLVQHDVRRAKALKARAKTILGHKLTFEEASIVNEPFDNQAFSYIASVGVGSPATICELSNTWVGSGTSYDKTSTSVETSNTVEILYGSGPFTGNEFTDTVTLGDLSISQQSIGVATLSTSFFGVDGILGLGPVDLTQGTLSPASGSLVPTVTDNLFSKGLIPANKIGISFEPTISLEVVNGEITWGGTDSTKFTGTIGFSPITTTEPASLFWGIDQAIRYGETTILPTTAGIVDTGTTLMLIASDAYESYQELTGAVFDKTVGLLRLTQTQFANLQSLFFKTGGVTYELTPNAQIWPRARNTDVGGSSSNVYLIVGDIGTFSREGLDFINGQVLLEHFYSIFDTANSHVRFATTPC